MTDGPHGKARHAVNSSETIIDHLQTYGVALTPLPIPRFSRPLPGQRKDTAQIRNWFIGRTSSIDFRWEEIRKQESASCPHIHIRSTKCTCSTTSSAVRGLHIALVRDTKTLRNEATTSKSVVHTPPHHIGMLTITWQALTPITQGRISQRSTDRFPICSWLRADPFNPPCRQN